MCVVLGVKPTVLCPPSLWIWEIESCCVAEVIPELTVPSFGYSHNVSKRFY